MKNVALAKKTLYRHKYATVGICVSAETALSRITQKANYTYKIKEVLALLDIEIAFDNMSLE